MGLKGQANIEYLLMMVLVFTMYKAVTGVLKRADFPGKMVAAFNTAYSPLYQYGHLKAKGPDDVNGGSSGSGFKYHPQLCKTGTDCVNRFFINPR